MKQGLSMSVNMFLKKTHGNLTVISASIVLVPSQILAMIWTHNLKVVSNRTYPISHWDSNAVLQIVTDAFYRFVLSLNLSLVVLNCLSFSSKSAIIFLFLLVIEMCCFGVGLRHHSSDTFISLLLCFTSFEFADYVFFHWPATMLSLR